MPLERHSDVRPLKRSRNNVTVSLGMQSFTVGKFPDQFGSACDPTANTFGNFTSQPSCSSSSPIFINGEKTEMAGTSQKSAEECETYWILRQVDEYRSELHPVETWLSFQARSKLLRSNVAKAQGADNAEDVIKARRTLFVEEEAKVRRMNKFEEKKEQKGGRMTGEDGHPDDEAMRNDILGEDMGFSREEKRRKKQIKKSRGTEDHDAHVPVNSSDVNELNQNADVDWDHVEDHSDDEGFLDKQGGDDLLATNEIDADQAQEVPVDLVESDGEQEKALDNHGREIQSLLDNPIKQQSERESALEKELTEMRAETMMQAAIAPDESEDMKDLCERTLALLGEQGGTMALRDFLKHFGVNREANPAEDPDSLRMSVLKTLRSLKKLKKVSIKERSEEEGGTLLRLLA